MIESDNWKIIRWALILLTLGSFLLALKSNILAEIVFDPVGNDQMATEERKLDFRYRNDKIIKVLAVRNLNNDAWTRDLQIEMKNVSGKPIYFLQIALVMPEDRSQGVESAFVWNYGDLELMKHDKLAEPTDVPIKPDESFVLTIPKDQAEGFEKSKDTRPSITKLVMEFNFINFGDGGLHSREAPTRTCPKGNPKRCLMIFQIGPKPDSPT
jgi:hypothetical protein